MDFNGNQVKDPVINEQALEWGFTNEGTADGEFRLLKNIMGLWLIQECRGTWAKKASFLLTKKKQRSFEIQNHLHIS
ncbi:hypothetical protein AAHB49_18100 [Bacillus cereus]